MAGTSRRDLIPERDDDRGDACAGREVGRDVRGRREAAVDAAEPARPHEADADGGRGRERAADRGRADRALYGAYGQVAWAELPRVGRESLELLRRETHDDAPVDDADRRWDGAGRAHRRLAREAYLDPRGSGEPVRDERRLQGDDRPLLGERGLDLVRHADQVLHAGEPSGRPAEARRRSAIGSLPASCPTPCRLSYPRTCPTPCPTPRSHRRSVPTRTSAPDALPNGPQGHPGVPGVTLSRKVGRGCAVCVSSSCRVCPTVRVGGRSG